MSGHLRFGAKVAPRGRWPPHTGTLTHCKSGRPKQVAVHPRVRPLQVLLYLQYPPLALFTISIPLSINNHLIYQYPPPHQCPYLQYPPITLINTCHTNLQYPPIPLSTMSNHHPYLYIPYLYLICNTLQIPSSKNIPPLLYLQNPPLPLSMNTPPTPHYISKVCTYIQFDFMEIHIYCFAQVSNYCTNSDLLFVICFIKLHFYFLIL